MFSKTVVKLIGAVIAGAVTSVLLTGPVQAATSVDVPAPLKVTLGIDSKGTVRPKLGRAQLTGTISCSRAATVQLVVQMTQYVDLQKVQRVYTSEVDCGPVDAPRYGIPSSWTTPGSVEWTAEFGRGFARFPNRPRNLPFFVEGDAYAAASVRVNGEWPSVYMGKPVTLTK